MRVRWDRALPLAAVVIFWVVLGVAGCCLKGLWG
jgi:hypothetical protein